MEGSPLITTYHPYYQPYSFDYTSTNLIFSYVTPPLYALLCPSMPLYALGAMR